jgi:ribonuclease HII
MVAAAVILPRDFDATGVRSSKRMRPSSRENAYERILREAVAVCVHEVSAADIDARGIDACNIELLREAVHRLEVQPDFVLVDYHTIPDLRFSQRAITNGDDLSVSIAAASIVAKVECDRMMHAFAEQYPEYGFGETKGYGSTEHEALITRLGPSPIHRRSVRPVRAWLAQHGDGDGRDPGQRKRLRRAAGDTTWPG